MEQIIRNFISTLQKFDLHNKGTQYIWELSYEIKDYFTKNPDKVGSEIVIYTDGSGTSTHLPGGWGFVVLDNGEQICEYSGALPKASNNEAELTAAIKGLKHVKKNFPDREVTLVSDSMLVLNYATGEWKLKAMHLTPLYIQIRRLYKEMEFKTRWVKGHSGNPHNTRADALARRARLSLVRPSS